MTSPQQPSVTAPQHTSTSTHLLNHRAQVDSIVDIHLTPDLLAVAKEMNIARATHSPQPLGDLVPIPMTPGMIKVAREMADLTIKAQDAASLVPPLRQVNTLQGIIRTVESNELAMADEHPKLEKDYKWTTRIRLPEGNNAGHKTLLGTRQSTIDAQKVEIAELEVKLKVAAGLREDV